MIIAVDSMAVRSPIRDGLLKVIMMASVVAEHRSTSSAQSFLPVTSSDGSTLCAVDTPSQSMSVRDVAGIPSDEAVPDSVRCAYHCSETTGGDGSYCGFNLVDGGLNSGSAWCQFYYNRPPVKCEVSAAEACRLYEVSGTNVKENRRSQQSIT